MMNNNTFPLNCPDCKNRTKYFVRSDTDAVNLPLYCQKCKKEFVVNIKAGKIIK